MPGWIWDRRKREKQAACFRSYHWETDDDEKDGEGSKKRQFRPTIGKRPRMRTTTRRMGKEAWPGEDDWGNKLAPMGYSPGLRTRLPVTIGQQKDDDATLHICKDLVRRLS